MSCNKKTKPEFTDEQLAECRDGCLKLASDNRWCGQFGCYIDKKEAKPRIIQPQIIKPPTMVQMAKHFTMAMAKWSGSGFKLVDKDTYFLRRERCSLCTDKKDCPICGCKLWAKAALATEECPKGYWSDHACKNK